ncbi:two-component system NarL family response regulator [Salirhabdus euzebyi]|uniref:Two-component system NarL family response regulator n=1 Tax=Salirhabdus euzebyi TaxID=394506 RepID=A0A841Q182_9BACI|nr:response regulator transcription factor [Salirhabdus euzebyi]MBB6451833.1 two-component system NarL family response regulator [Salirhabdus euzebyi]
MGIRVLIVDDHQVVRKGLVYFFNTLDDIEIAGEAANGEEAIQFLQQENEVDVVLLDVQMPVMDGVEAAQQIRSLFPKTKILMLTSFSDYNSVIPAIKAGASGYQLKDADPEILANAIRKVADGEKMIDHKAASHLFQHVSGNEEEEKKAKLAQLTNRELDVLQEMMNGKSNKEIANDLYITEKTVKTHVSNILSKLEVHDRTQAALFGVKYLASH